MAILLALANLLHFAMTSIAAEPEKTSAGELVGKASAVPAASANRTEAEAIAAVRAELDKRTADSKFSGAVLIAKDGQPVFEAAYGYADRENKITNTVDTKFRFGSMGKMFTAVAVLQLAQTGKIDLQAPIAKYLPDYPNQEVAAVTVYQLLTHTGGTGNIFTPEFGVHRKELKELKDYVALYGKRGVDFKPGTQWDYSNYGFILLGSIIEVVSGQSYYDYVRDHIFQPAGMNSTGNLPEDQDVPSLAVCYTGPDFPGSAAPKGPLRPATDTLPYRGTSAGGGYSTVGDFLRFANAFTTHKLLNAEYIGVLTTGKVATSRPGIKYAFGFEDELTRDGVRCFGHGGGAPGMNGKLSVFPVSNYVVIALANVDPPAAGDIAGFIRDQLPLK